MDDTNWYLRGVMVAGSYYPSPRLTKLWCREMMMNHGYAEVDTFLTGWDSPSAINASINEGVTLVNYRGYGAPEGWTSPYYTYSNVAQLSNGPRYGVMTSIVCGTGDYNDSWADICLGEAWIRYPNKGGPGFMGTTEPDTHTQWNNTIDCGVYWGLFEENTVGLAQALLMGKMNLYNAYPNDTYANGQVQQYFYHYNVLGDPALVCWTGIPKAMQVTHAGQIDVGPAGFTVDVTDESSAPLANAYVCLWKGDELHVGKFTDSNGQAAFQVQTAAAGDLLVTITKASFIPSLDTVVVGSAEVALGMTSCLVDDDSQGNSSGDGDLIANPAETVELGIMLLNSGTSQTATGITAVLTSNDDYAEVISGSSSYADIAPGDSAVCDQPFVVAIDPLTPDGHDLELVLDITDAASDSWQSIVHVPVAAADLNVDAVSIDQDDDGDNVLDPGESGQMILTLFNGGSKAIYEAEAILRTADPSVQVTDSLGYFNDIFTSDSSDNADDPFGLMVEADVYTGHQIHFTLEVTGSTGQLRTFDFTHVVGTVNGTDPTGPDEYGYYCFDNTDTSYAYHPEYEWIPIETSWTLLNIYDDEILTRDLPFEVQYYGETYDQFSVSDNGYLTMGQSWWSNFLNTNIPAPQCAPAMIAPFWDDLRDSVADYRPLKVRYNYDDANGRFIIGWQSAHSNDSYQNYTFEVIILDAEMWPTPTGDNEIIFQYFRCNNAYSASVGICNEIRDIGLQYLFDNHYSNGAATLSAGRAIKFTTGSEYLVAVNEQGSNLPEEYALSQNYPNPFNPSTNISYDLPGDGRVTLEIFDILGRKVKTLVNQYQLAGSWTVTWDARDSGNQPVSAGMYFYRLRAGDTEMVKKMLLIK